MRFLVAVIAMTTLAGCASRGSSQPTVEMPLDHCPPAGTEPAYPSGGVLRDDPVLVRICSAERAPAPPPTGVPLTEGGQELVDLVNDLDPASSMTCTSVGGRIYTLWFGYEDDQAQAVVVDEGGCGTIDAGGDPLVMDSARQVWTTYEDLLNQ